MVRPQLLNADKIRRKDRISNHDRTDDRDRAADILEEEWPTQLSALEEEYDYSRQHFANTLELYFYPVHTTVEEVEIVVPDDGAVDIKLDLTIRHRDDVEEE